MKKVFLLTAVFLIISLLIGGCSSGNALPTAAPAEVKEATAAPEISTALPTATETVEEPPTPDLPEPTATPTEAPPAGPIVFEDATFRLLMERTFSKTEFFPEDFENLTDLLIGADEVVILDADYESYQFFYHPRFNQDFTFAIDGKTFENAVGTIRTLADLKYFKSLERLELIYHTDADLDTLPALPNLNNLTIVIGKAGNLEFLNQLEGLQRLDLYLLMEPGTEPDTEPIRALKQLKSLGLMYIPITDLGFLEDKRDLTQLAIVDAPVEDFTAVASLTNLQSVYIETTKLKDVTPFMGLENLKSLILDLNEIDAEGIGLLQELQEGYALEGKELYIDLLD